MARRYLHHHVFYGFLFCLAATAIAAFYDHFLHAPAPYRFLSWPVVLGTLGGVSILIGTTGLLYLKLIMDRRPSPANILGMDVSFLLLLLLVSLSGLLLLFLRETAAMGLFFLIHMGFVFGFFLMLPYSKFIHAIYRYAALVGNAKEQLKQSRN